MERLTETMNLRNNENIRWITIKGKRIPIHSYLKEGKDPINFSINQMKKYLGRNVSVYNGLKNLNGNIISTEQLNRSFDRIANTKNIPWEYTKDGCFARAHLAAGQLVARRYNVSKIIVEPIEPWWKVFKENNPFKVSSKHMLSEWNYHIAAMTYAETPEGIKGYVIDPSIDSKKPLEVHEWIDSFRKRKTGIQCFIVPADVFSPIDISKEPKSFSPAKFRKFMVPAKLFNRDCSEVLGRIKERNKRGRSDYVKIR